MEDEEIKVLLVEDNWEDAELELRELKRAGLRCVGRRVETAKEFQRELAEFRPDIILSDFSMPNFDGMAALAYASKHYSQIPFLFVSGTLGEEYAIRALKNGATDYVIKNNLIRLPASVERALEDANSVAERKRVENSLRLSEQRYRLAASTAEVWDWIVETGEMNVSPQWKKHLGFESGEISNTVAGLLALVHPDDRPAVERAFDAHLTQKVPCDVEYRARAKGGDLRWFHAKGQALWDEAGKATYMAGTFVEITGRKQAEIRAQRLIRVHAMLGEINALILRAHDWDELFREACRIAVGDARFAKAWIGVVEQPFRRLTLAACAGGNERFFEVLVGLLNRKIAQEKGHVARAIVTREPQVSSDVLEDAEPDQGQESHLSRSRSMAALPIVVHDATVAVLALHADAPGFFDAEVMKILAPLANDIGFALAHPACGPGFTSDTP